MKVILVSTYTYPVALGLRFISSYLKSAGHQVTTIFMSSKRDTAEADFPAGALEDFIDRCRDADLIGLSLMTNTYHRACYLTEALRESGNKVPIIWGGVHPTVSPDESLEVADMVCVGEGEEPMRLLVE
ncbi:MAG: cobalamin B12-binding domain-containing protein, partial [Planctomycetota bacterium]